MNIQIFGTKKCNDTRKAERFFKERGIKYQFIDMKEKGMSKGEFTAVAASNGGMETLLDEKCKNQDTLFLIKYLAEYESLLGVFFNDTASMKQLKIDVDANMKNIKNVAGCIKTPVSKLVPTIVVSN